MTYPLEWGAYGLTAACSHSLEYAREELPDKNIPDHPPDIRDKNMDRIIAEIYLIAIDIFDNVQPEGSSDGEGDDDVENPSEAMNDFLIRTVLHAP